MDNIFPLPKYLYSVYPQLCAALTELKEKVESLEARVVELEAVIDAFTTDDGLL